MLTSRLYISLQILIISCVLLTGESVLAACKIEKGPPPELAEYIRTSTEQARSLVGKYPNICGARQDSPMTSLNKTLSILDKAQIQNAPGQVVPIMNSIITDFTYNVYALSLGNTSPTVIMHGQLLYKLEKSTLIPTLDKLSANCQLGGEAETEIVALLSRNNHVQDFFKNTVIGTTGRGSDTLENAIIDNYQGDAISTCKDSLDLSTAIEKGIQATEKFGTNFDEAVKNWKESIALLRGTTTSSKKSYNQLQKELLQSELRRQGLSQSAIQQMVSNLECMQVESTGLGDIAGWSRARVKCIGNPIIGYQNAVDAWNAVKWGISERVEQFGSLLVETPRTTDEFIMAQDRIDQHVLTEKAILYTYGLVKTESQSLWDEEATTNIMVSNLINMHANLVGINGYLQKRIPIMQANCMKGNPGIVGGCYIR